LPPLGNFLHTPLDITITTGAQFLKAADNRSSEGKQAKQLSEIEQLQDQLSKNLQEHREVEQTLRKVCKLCFIFSEPTRRWFGFP